MKNWTKALMLSALLFSGSAIAKETDAQTELEEKIDKRIKRALENPLGAS